MIQDPGTCPSVLTPVLRFLSRVVFEFYLFFLNMETLASQLSQPHRCFSMPEGGTVVSGWPKALEVEPAGQSLVALPGHTLS